MSSQRSLLSPHRPSWQSMTFLTLWRLEKFSAPSSSQSLSWIPASTFRSEVTPASHRHHNLEKDGNEVKWGTSNQIRFTVCVNPAKKYDSPSLALNCLIVCVACDICWVGPVDGSVSRDSHFTILTADIPRYVSWLVSVFFLTWGPLLSVSPQGWWHIPL